MKDTETSKQCCLIESDGENPDSVKEVWLNPKSAEPVIKYRINYPSKKSMENTKEA